jgi:hypothetical protein
MMISNCCKFSFHVIQERLEDIELHTCKTLVAVWTLFSSRSSTWYGCLDGLASSIAVSVFLAGSSLCSHRIQQLGPNRIYHRDNQRSLTGLAGEPEHFPLSLSMHSSGAAVH